MADENKNKEVDKEKKTPLGYTGVIKVSVQKNKKIIRTKTYKNNGTNLLFQFFARCLAQEWTRAASLAPIRILLKNNNNNNNVRATAEIGYNAPPDVMYQNGSWVCVYHFLIPSNIILEDQVTDAELYSCENGLLASFKFMDETNSNIAPITDLHAGNYNLIIDWELSVSNQKDEAEELVASAAANGIAEGE